MRTPLTSLRTNVELLMASMAPGAPRLPEEEMEGLREDVIAQIEELSTLVGDLVDLTRDEAGVVIHEPVDMTEIVYRSLERVRRRRNDIEFDVAVAPWQVYGDGGGLARAVLNLLDNAAKWSPPGGRVGVRLTQIDPMHAELVVSDQGPGIPPEERRLVFERFFRSTIRACDAGFGTGAGDCETDCAQTRWHAAGGGHRPRRTTAGHRDSRGAARPVPARNRRRAPTRAR